MHRHSEKKSMVEKCNECEEDIEKNIENAKN